MHQFLIEWVGRSAWIFIYATAAIAPGIAAAPIIPPPPAVAASSYLLIDAKSQKVLVENNAAERVPPASLTKIMTAYILEEEINSGRLKVEETAPISVKAWRTGGSTMFIREGTEVAVGDLLKGIIIQSGNDASVAVAEHIAGSEDAFAEMMNQQAKALGLDNTNFMNATGLPSDNHYSTAEDLALLTIALIQNHPEQYQLYSERSYKFNGIDQPNRNKLLWRDRSVDGVKTGYTSAAGYCLIASAERNGVRLVSVVLGTDSDEARMRESQKLLSYGFRNFDTQTLYQAGVNLQLQDVYFGQADKVELGVPEDVTVTFPRGYYDDIKVEMTLSEYLEAPIAAGQEVGEIQLILDGEVLHKEPLQTLQAVEESNFFSRMGDSIYLFYASIFSNDG
ncbi:MAG: serine-type D-Ala-D-Ala carboxypeptidase [Proteobacteria bacterium]|nr:serine-type D-Ala-D-Ala carboxypeptidase [Pseudomonadota bacterium]